MSAGITVIYAIAAFGYGMQFKDWLNKRQLKGRLLFDVPFGEEESEQVMEMLRPLHNVANMARLAKAIELLEKSEAQNEQ